MNRILSITRLPLIINLRGECCSTVVLLCKVDIGKIVLAIIFDTSVKTIILDYIINNY
jgi:hypothetical protein